MGLSSRISNFLAMAREGRIGFKITEKMSGKHEFEPGFGPRGRLEMEFEAIWGPEHLTEWLNPSSDTFLRQPMHGHVTIEGLCEDEKFSGHLNLLYFSEAKIRYEFEFNVEGEEYQYTGEKRNLRPWNLHRTHTTLYGQLTEKETGRLVSTSELYFYWSNLPGMISSFQLA